MYWVQNSKTGNHFFRHFLQSENGVLEVMRAIVI